MWNFLFRWKQFGSSQNSTDASKDGNVYDHYLGNACRGADGILWFKVKPLGMTNTILKKIIESEMSGVTKFTMNVYQGRAVP